MEYDSDQRDCISVLCSVRWDCAFANCKDKLAALCKHAVGTEHTVALSCSQGYLPVQCKLLSYLTFK